MSDFDEADKFLRKTFEIVGGLSNPKLIASRSKKHFERQGIQTHYIVFNCCLRSLLLVRAGA